MPTKVLQVLDLRSNMVEIKRGREAGSSKRSYILEDAEGDWYTTFDSDIARRAQPFKGQTAEVEYSEREVGDKTYRNLLNIRGANGATPAPVAQASGAETGQEKADRIHRMHGTTDAIAAVAAGIVDKPANLTELKLLAQSLADFYADGFEEQQQAQPRVQVDEIKQEGFPPTEDDGNAVTPDDDIPF